MKKKQTPLVVLKETKKMLDEIREIAGNNRSTIKIKENQEGALVYLEDIDHESDFYFRILSVSLNEVVIRNVLTNKIKYKYSFCPENSTSVNKWAGSNESTKIIELIKKWLENLKEYNDIHLFKDEIVEKYTERFFSDFEIIDENANVEPFELEQQLFLNEYLDIIEQVLDNNKDEFDVTEIKKEVVELKQNLTRLPKNSVLKKLSKIWAKAQKEGLKLLHETYTSFKKEVIKRVTHEGLEGIEQIGETIKQLFN